MPEKKRPAPRLAAEDAAAALEGTPGFFPGDAQAFGTRAGFAALPSGPPEVAPQTSVPLAEQIERAPAPSPSPGAWQDPVMQRLLASGARPGIDYDPRGTPEPRLERFLGWLSRLQDSALR